MICIGRTQRPEDPETAEGDLKDERSSRSLLIFLPIDKLVGVKMAIIHIVHFAYSCDEATKQEIASRFLQMKTTCLSVSDSKPYILSLTGGKNSSPEGMNDGLEVCAISESSAIAVAAPSVLHALQPDHASADRTISAMTDMRSA